MICIDAANKEKAKISFLLPNIWILSFIPMACLFNIADGLLGGYTPGIAPLPLPGNSFLTFGLYWVIYMALCIGADIMIRKRES